MKKLNTTFIFVLLFNLLHAQSPLVKQWDYRFGGMGTDELRVFQQTKDGGYILAGGINSDSSGDVSERSRSTNGTDDFWIVKTDANGIKQWDKRFGGNQSEYINSVLETADNGYLLGGYTSSDSTGDVTQTPRGYVDFWIVKTDSIGNKQWDKRYGGSNGDFLYCMLETPDRGYILGGFTSSDSSVDVSEHNHGGSDFWIVKIDSLGNKLWDKLYGGTFDDRLFTIYQKSNGSYILGGRTWSDSTGDVSNHNNGYEDFWILEIDSIGNKQWDKIFGGATFDKLNSMQLTRDGGYIFAGNSDSDSGGSVTQPTKGCSDFWVVKVDSLGNKQWDKRYGGNLCEDEYGYIRNTFDGGYLLSGSSYSPISGDKTENNLGYEQSWFVKLDSIGNKQWDKTLQTLSTPDDEISYAIQSDDGCYVVANYTGADTGGCKTQMSRGSWDFWFIKFCDSTQTGEVGISEIENEIAPNLFPNPTSKTFTIENISSKEETVVEIINVFGETVYAEKLLGKNECVVDANFAKGIYFVRVNNVVRKLVVE